MASQHASDSKPSALCNRQLRDPLTLAISFMPNPGQFRGACTFTVECWDHARYLEVPLLCSLAFEDETNRCYPLTLRGLGQFPTVGDCKMSFVDCKPQTLPGGKRPAQPDRVLVTRVELHHRKLTRVVGQRWLSGCTSLVSVAFVDLPKLEFVGPGWLQACTSLKVVSFANLPELAVVRDYWLHGCISLETVTFERLPRLQCVGDYWLQRCTSLKSVSFVDLPQLATVGKDFLQGCESLESVRLERLPKLQSVAYDFLTKTAEGFPNIEPSLDLPPECQVQWQTGSSSRGEKESEEK